MLDYIEGGKTLIESGPILDLWRAYTDNNKAPIKKRHSSGAWRDSMSMQDNIVASVDKLFGSAVRGTVQATLPNVNAAYELIYTVYGNGEIAVDAQLDQRSDPSACATRTASALNCFYPKISTK